MLSVSQVSWFLNTLLDSACFPDQLAEEGICSQRSFYFSSSFDSRHGFHCGMGCALSKGVGHGNEESEEYLHSTPTNLRNAGSRDMYAEQYPPPPLYKKATNGKTPSLKKHVYFTRLARA